MTIRTVEDLVSRLRHLRKLRDEQKIVLAPEGRKRKSPDKKQRESIFIKTGGRCHICGGQILEGERWQADHVFAFAQGGDNLEANYLPAHSICNNYRWFYGAEEFQWILKLGVWFRTEIERENADAVVLAKRFVSKEVQREGR